MKALLVIDIQKGLTKKGLYNSEVFIETVNLAINKFRESKDMIIFVQHNNNQLVNGSKDWEIDDRIPRQHNDLIIQKEHGNAFEKTELKNIIQNNNVKEILVCGLVTNGCVKATCIGGIKNNLTVNLLAKGHSNWNKDAKAKISSTESELKQLGVKIIDI